MKFNIVYQTNHVPMAIVKEHLNRFKLSYKMLNGCEFDIADAIGQNVMTDLEASLQRYGIEIIHDRNSQLLQKIKNILTDIAYADHQQQFTLSAHLSDKLNLSYGYISSFFRLFTLTSIENYLTLVRIERAKKLLIENNMPVKEISHLLHYSSVSHFSRQFKKTTGLTVSVFRRIVENRRRVRAKQTNN